MSIVVTAGAANANSFATLNEFDAYAETRLPSVAAVLAATDDAKEAALIVSCRSLGANLAWTGAAVDAVQALTWPRLGMLTRNGFAIPTSGATSLQPPLKDAQCELAYQLLAGANLVADNDALNKNVSSVKAGDVAVSFQNVDLSSVEAVDMFIRRLGSEFNYISSAIPGEVRRLLVPSWFEQPSILRPVMFGAM